jgi:hypothetical protein
MFTILGQAPDLAERHVFFRMGICDRAFMIESDVSRAPEEEAVKALADRRRHRRVAVELPGRYMLEDGSEHPCICADISVGGARLRAAQAGPWGSRVVAYIDGVGRIEGHIVRRAVGWFAIETRASQRKFERVQERIEMIAQAGGAPDVRRERREWTHRPVRLYTLDGQAYAAELTDVSREGAALLTDAVLQEGERVRLDSRRAVVARLFPGGAALRFENWVDDNWARREPSDPGPLPRARRA